MILIPIDRKYFLTPQARTAHRPHYAVSCPFFCWCDFGSAEGILFRSLEDRLES